MAADSVATALFVFPGRETAALVYLSRREKPKALQ